jgi:hypothetical protein
VNSSVVFLRGGALVPGTGALLFYSRLAQGEVITDHLAIVAALEALDAGDTRYAVEILLGALEDGDTWKPCRCACGVGYRWPGELDAHRVALHEERDHASD